MTFRTILVGASGGSANDGAVELACQLAVRFHAHLEGYHVKFDPTEIRVAASSGGIAVPAARVWIDDMKADAARLADRTKTGFFSMAERYGLIRADEPPHDLATVSWRDDVGRAGELVPARARFFDLVVLGRSARVIDMPSTDVVEQTLLRSGRPTLLAPSVTPSAFGGLVAIGWDGSAQSVRAVAAALPLLRAARAVVILSVDGKSDVDATAASEHLLWHGVRSKCQDVYAVSGAGYGAQLLAASRDAGADLLVMGAFGHAPWRETLFGGATREIVANSLLAVLMMH